ncbi:hypothetical protein bcgnr5372_46220 [Bacillus luti]|nr:hypothetical protein [Bacillus cereus]HDR8330554.1 hypothetical protein [Bacillus cereus]HDR8338112.1 hypothetical protein [Bacillus cereus]
MKTRQKQDQYVYLCNECDNVHEDKTEICEICPGATRPVSRGDLEMD